MELREGYKKTELGIIPEDWGIEAIGEKVSVLRGGSPRPIQDYITSAHNGINWIKIGDVGVDSKYIDQTEERIKPEGVSRSRTVEVGDLLLSNSMSFGRPYILRINGCIHDGWLVLKEFQRTFSKDYLYYILCSELVINQYISKASGSSVMNLNKELVSSVLLPIPPHPEQQAIASALSDIDSLISSLTKLIDKKKNIKQGAIQELLTGKKRLEGFSGEWGKIKLGDVGKCIRGVSYNGSKDLYINDNENSIRLLRSNNIQEAKIDFSDLQYVNKLRAKEVQILLPEDIIICMANGSKDLVGKTALYQAGENKKYTFGAFMGCFRSSDLIVNKRFIFYFFQSNKYKEYIKILLSGSSINNLKPCDVESMELDCPNIEEQTAIANILSDMDSEIEALEEKLDKYKAIKQGMMEELLTGRIRLI